MINNIQEHHNDEEVQKLSMESTVELWRQELEFNEKEIQFYLILLRSTLIEKTRSNNIDAEFLLKQFNELKESNYSHKKTCLKFQNSLTGMEECDDIQCDHAYLKSYLIFKNKIEKHFTIVRKIKESGFEYLQQGIERYSK